MASASCVHFRREDLEGAAIRALIARHLAGLRANTPPESMHALGLEQLREPGVMVWSAWIDDQLAGCGALKRLDAERAELKSMRVVDALLGRGVGKALLAHLIREALALGVRSVWLETGSTPDFIPAIRLYEGAGFVRCGPFDGYVDDPLSIFMMRPL